MSGFREAPAVTSWMALLVLLLGGSPVLGEQEAGAPARGSEAPKRLTLLERNRKLVRDLHRLGPWPEQAELIRQANRNLFERYGWASEEDRFALKLAEDVARIPPWDFMGRFDSAYNALANRYQLDAEQGAQIKPKVMWRTLRLMGRHVPTLFELSEEMVAARLERRPFTPAEVARWSQLSEPVVLDARAEFEEFCREVEPLLAAHQREILARDRAADDRRARTFLAKLGDWQQGKWEPRDWGLQDDPYHGGHSGGRQAGPDLVQGDARQAEAPTPRYDPADENAWQRYVRDLIRRYRLDQEQETAARAILQDVETQAGVYRSAILREAAPAPSADRMDRIKERLFEELKRRLDQIPTEKQRRAAGEAALPVASRDGPVSSAPGPPAAPSPAPAAEAGE